MRLRIDVTQEDIDRGVRKSARQCMVHRAIDQATEGALGRFAVAPGGVFPEGGPGLAFPEQVGELISAWDRGARINPFSFDLDMSPLLQEAGI